MRTLWLMLAVLALAMPGAAQEVKVEDLRWLAGSWYGEAGGAMEEHWTVPAGATMMGSCRIVSEGRTVHREFMLLEEGEDGVVLTIHLPTRTVPFRRVSGGPTEALFETAEAPRERLLYRLEEDGTLYVRLEKEKEGQPFTLEFRLSREAAR